jgi:cytochrome c553
MAILMAAVALSVASARAADPKENFEKIGHCDGCHGKDGKGQTNLGIKLGCRDYTDPKVQEKLKDEEMTKAIKEGLKKGERTLMKPYAEKFTDAEIKALVEYMRKFKKAS